MSKTVYVIVNKTKDYKDYIMSPKNISIVISVIVIVWVLSGALFGTKREDAEKPSEASGQNTGKLLKVESLTAQDFTRTVTLNGFTEANRMIELKPEVEGKIIELPVKKGMVVEAGQLIARLDNRDRAEKLAEAKAKLDARTIEYEASKELKEKGFRPRMGLADSKANLETARVDLAQAKLNFDNTQIKAPFTGRLEELNIELGDFVLSGYFGSLNGKVMARLVEDSPIKISGQISEKDLPFIQKDSSATIVLSDGRELKGVISFVGQYADNASRSFRVEVLVDNPDHNVPIGITATLKLFASVGKAYQVASSVLTLSDDGKPGVKIIDDAGIVQFVPVAILDSTAEGVWINGLAEHIKLISSGQTFINAGQKWEEPKNDAVKAEESK